MTYPISGLGYPNYFSAQATASPAAQPWLMAETARDFGLATPPVYNLQMDVNSAYNTGMYGGGMYGGYGFMMPRYSQAYLNYINMDYKDRLNYDHAYNQAAREFNHAESRSAKQFAALEDGETGNISMACRSLQAAITDGDTDQVVREFERIVNALKASPIYDKLIAEGARTPEQIDLQLRDTAFRQFQAATGQDLTEMISAKCDGAIANGFFNTITFGNGQKYSKEEMISKLYGKNPPKSTQALKVTGKVGGVLAAAGTGALVGSAFGGPLVGGVIGAIVGAIGACC